MTESPTTQQEPIDYQRSAQFKTAELIGKILIHARKQGQIPEVLDLNDDDHLATLSSLLAPYVLSIADQFVDVKLKQLVTDVEQTFVDIFGTAPEPGGEAGPAPTPTGKQE